MGHLFRKDSKEIQKSGVSINAGTKSGADSLEHVLPRLHLYGEDGEADAERDTDRLGTSGEMLEQKQDLVAQGGVLIWRHLSAEIIGDLGRKAPRLAGVVVMLRCAISRVYLFTLPRRVTAANSCTSGSAVDLSIARVLGHASFCFKIRAYPTI